MLIMAAVSFTIALALWHTQLFYREFISGDIPHYLVATQSIAEDGDFDLENNYADPESHAAFYRGALAPQYAPGTFRPYRSIGIPLLLLPGWIAHGHWGALATAAVVLSLAAGVLGSVARVETGSNLAAAALALLTIFHLPTIAYLFCPYPDVFSGVANLFFFLILTRRIPRSSHAMAWVIAAALLSASLIWLHQKFAALLPLHWTLLVIWTPRGRRVGAGAVSGAIMALGVALYLIHHLSAGVDLGAYLGDTRPTPWPQAFFGLLFDRQFGLFWQFPLLVLPVAEVVRQLLVGPRRVALTAVALMGAVWALHAWYWYWFGGLAPAGRHTLNFLFILLYFFIPFFNERRLRSAWGLTAVCLLMALFHVLFIAWILTRHALPLTINIHPYLFVLSPEPDFIQYPWWGRAKIFWEIGLDEYLPSLIYITGKGLRTLMVAVSLVSLFALWHSWPSLRAQGKPRVRSVAIFAAAWILGWGFVYWDLHEHHQRRPVEHFVEIWGHPPDYFQTETPQ